MKKFILIFVLALCAKSQYVQSPCPGLFAYQSDANGVYGLIELKSRGGAVNTLHLRANFTVAAQLTSTYVGQIQTIGGDNLLTKFNRGIPINYRVNFPVTSPIPKLTSIVVNGEPLCYGQGDQQAPSQYITTISLDHMLYLKGVPSTDYFNYGSNPTSNVDFFPQLDNGNTQVFTINDLGDRWNTGSFSSQDPFNIINITHQTRPIYEQPVTYPTKPIYPAPTHSKPTYPSPSQSKPIYPAPVQPRPEYPAPVQPRPEYPAPVQSRPEYPAPVQPRPEYPAPTQARPEYPAPVRPKPDYTMYYPETTKATRAPPQLPSVPPTASLPSTPPRLPAFSPIECGVIAGGNERVPLIYNGNTYNRGEWPWLVAIYKRQEGSLTFICSGTLITERHVITAAHCMRQKSKMSTIKDIVVKIGVYNLEDWGDDISVTRTLQAAAIHESYNATTLENDILVFTMERTVQFNNYIRPACLWSGNTDLTRIVGASGVVAGWGASEVGPVGQGEPRVVRIPVVSTAACRASRPEFHKLTSSKTLCAGDRKGSGPCLGDSGGGLYILDSGRWRIRGIVSLSLRPSNGDNTCNLDEYIVFTDTAQYLGWIRKILSQKFFDT